MSHAASPFRRPDATGISSVDTSSAVTEVLTPVTDETRVTDESPVTDEDELLAPPVDDDLNARIAKAAPRRLANRATVVLAGLALLVAGFVAGAQVQKSYGQAPAASGPAGGVNPAAFPSGFAGRNGAQGGAQGGQARGGITGTVKLVDGTTVYVETADGQTLIVKTSGTTTVSTPGALKDLTAGSSVTVVGQNTDGTVNATSITKTK
ncbi:hypothetical protein GCM10010399_42920 [Dactylosporangium fulvum]|uniref:DUF5666 domain-containing protein n=1 Tax=Dactylosporangium fulvum TaxID=53359 RepID=A0ABY5VYI8_9ACTN|nr:hypothetical protein [Dactylosporangium fulvum]UWP82868.1 hypothetical protein Dfulv_00690 [Dactylosporangium fulvum]